MSKKEPIKIEIEKTLNVLPEDVYTAKVVKAGNGANIRSFKRYLGKEVIIIVAKEKVKEIKKQKSKEEQERINEKIMDATELSHIKNG